MSWSPRAIGFDWGRRFLRRLRIVVRFDVVWSGGTTFRRDPLVVCACAGGSQREVGLGAVLP
jgi:hypothetical protein